jgi:hypothetical protein
MDFLRRLFTPNRRPTADALHLYVRCNHCGAIVHVRVNLYNDLSVDYDDDVVSGYRLRKEIMDSRCFRLMYADLTFDRNRREIARQIEDGEFVSREEYEQANRS